MAIALLQDLNNNGKLDTNLLGIPKEPYAFSNNIKPVFSAPKFQQYSFEFAKENQLISISLKKNPMNAKRSDKKAVVEILYQSFIDDPHFN